MRINRRLLFAGLISAVVGAGAIIVSISFNHYTSATAFCASCHSMAFRSRHRLLRCTCLLVTQSGHLLT
jgi:nitrate/TMAO reductase-like tetraheme cytochrome c subunit